MESPGSDMQFSWHRIGQNLSVFVCFASRRQDADEDFSIPLGPYCFCLCKPFCPDDHFPCSVQTDCGNVEPTY